MCTRQSRAYTFSGDYLVPSLWFGAEVGPHRAIEVGTPYDVHWEGYCEGDVERIPYNARPFLSVTWIRNKHFRINVDTTFLPSTGHLDCL